MSRTRTIIPTVDGWRAVAALMVLFCHGVSTATPLHYLRPLSGHAVMMFFTMSGLLITTRFIEEEREKGRIDLKAFYLRRAFRILPAVLVFMFALASLSASGLALPVPKLELLSGTFFFQNYIPPFEGRSPYTFHLWSLSVEEHFYLLWPALFLVLGSGRAKKAVPFIAAAFGLWRICDTVFGIVWSDAHPIFNAHRTDHVIDAILWGCYLALALQDERVKAFLTRALSFPVWAALLGVFVFSEYRDSVVMENVRALVAPLLLAGTVLRPNDLAGRILENRALKFIGKVSFPMYLFQQLFFVGAFREPNLLQRFPMNFIVLFGLSTLLHYTVEKPCIRLGARALQWIRRPAAPAPVATT